jgi:hypothetical protein
MDYDLLLILLQILFQDIFTAFNVTSTRQATLAGNQWIQDVHKLVWKSASYREKGQTASYVRDTKFATIKPMEIGTYIISVTKSSL